MSILAQIKEKFISMKVTNRIADYYGLPKYASKKTDHANLAKLSDSYLKKTPTSEEAAADNLILLRLLFNHSLDEISSQAGVPISTIEAYEQGQRPFCTIEPDFEKLLKFYQTDNCKIFIYGYYFHILCSGIPKIHTITELKMYRPDCFYSDFKR